MPIQKTANISDDTSLYTFITEAKQNLQDHHVDRSAYIKNCNEPINWRDFKTGYAGHVPSSKECNVDQYELPQINNWVRAYLPANWLEASSKSWHALNEPPKLTDSIQENVLGSHEDGISTYRNGRYGYLSTHFS